MLATVALTLIAAPIQAPPVKVARVKTFDQFRIVSLAAGPGSTVAFGLEDNSVKVFNTAKLMSVATLGGHPQPVYALSFNKAGTQLLTADVTARIYLWDVKTGKKIKEFSREKGHTKSIKAIAFSPNGLNFATVGDDDFLKVWSVKGAHPVASVAGNAANLYGVGFTPSGSVVTGTLTGEVRVYSIAGNLVAKMAAPNSNGINGLATNWAGNTVTASRDGRLVLWNMAAKSKAGSFMGHTDWAINAAISPNGQVGASSGSDGRVSLWQLKTNVKLGTLENQSYVGSPIAFTEDGKNFLTGNASGFLEVYSVTPPQGVAAKRTPKRRR